MPLLMTDGFEKDTTDGGSIEIMRCAAWAVLARASGDTSWDYERHYRAVVAA